MAQVARFLNSTSNPTCRLRRDLPVAVRFEALLNPGPAPGSLCLCFSPTRPSDARRTEAPSACGMSAPPTGRTRSIRRLPLPHEPGRSPLSAAGESDCPKREKERERQDVAVQCGGARSAVINGPCPRSRRLRWRLTYGARTVVPRKATLHAYLRGTPHQAACSRYGWSGDRIDPHS
ncbi:hypothetical protein BDY21DRAFT_336156 [Lineolata rhizophorae]|uniref:Uncharacterized protein n=1 Tax=Lineolata rhizophorae TaxID=578093 RepID=A0A6A6P9P4_9PEZI|nr:hypothetical protein BDY21DRAFT_336156 [Lineolata rhizophorae]